MKGSLGQLFTNNPAERTGFVSTVGLVRYLKYSLLTLVLNRTIVWFVVDCKDFSLEIQSDFITYQPKDASELF